MIVMSPESHQNLLPGVPVGQPGQPAQAAMPGLTSAQPLIPSHVEGASASVDLAERVSEQARALVDQYQQDPYRLSGALQQLKAKYLADQFQITTKTTEG